MTFSGTLAYNSLIVLLVIAPQRERSLYVAARDRREALCKEFVPLVLADAIGPWSTGPRGVGPLSNRTTVAISAVEGNPKALVPVLVHNGVVITESSDIIDYLDQRFPPNPPLRPSDPAELERM
jgi:Glutathione S-transferase, N-terminal domain